MPGVVRTLLRLVAGDGVTCGDIGERYRAAAVPDSTLRAVLCQYPLCSRGSSLTVYPYRKKHDPTAPNASQQPPPRCPLTHPARQPGHTPEWPGQTHKVPARPPHTTRDRRRGHARFSPPTAAPRAP